MIEVIIEDTTEELEKQGAWVENNCTCVGGYGFDNEVHLDCSLSYPSLRLALIHEVLHLRLNNRIKHSKIDQVAIDIIDALFQIGALNDQRGIKTGTLK